MCTNPLLRGGTPSTFLELAGRVFERHAKGAPFFEWMLQDTIQQFLEETHWQNCEVEANRPRRGDLAVLFGRNRQPYFIVEFKRAASLSSMDVMQGRNYSALHRCPCIVTNGIDYLLIIAQEHCSSVSVAKLPVTVTESQHILFNLGRFELKKTSDGQRERLLVKIFSSVDEGPYKVKETVQEFAETAMQRARALPPSRRSPQRLLSLP